jgi:hypothetical protein
VSHWSPAFTGKFKELNIQSQNRVYFCI